MIQSNETCDYGFFCDIENHTPTKSYNKVPKTKKYFIPKNKIKYDGLYGNSFDSLDRLDYLNSEEIKQDLIKKEDKEELIKLDIDIKKKIYFYIFVSFTAICYATIIFF